MSAVVEKELPLSIQLEKLPVHFLRRKNEVIGAAACLEMLSSLQSLLKWQLQPTGPHNWKRGAGATQSAQIEPCFFQRVSSRSKCYREETNASWLLLTRIQTAVVDQLHVSNASVFVFILGTACAKGRHWQGCQTWFSCAPTPSRMWILPSGASSRRTLLGNYARSLDGSCGRSLKCFRPFQREIIVEALAGNDVFVQAATSFGKSLCFQLPAVIDRGSTSIESQGAQRCSRRPVLTYAVTIVISPLLSLMVWHPRWQSPLCTPGVANSSSR